MKTYIYVLFFALFLVGCTPDNQVGARYSIERTIKNGTAHKVELKMFVGGIKFDTLLLENAFITFTADCEVTGSDIGCDNPNYNIAFAQAHEDSIHIIFNHDKILRFNRAESQSCLERNILLPESPCGYIVEDGKEGMKVYTYIITQEDFDNAEPI